MSVTKNGLDLGEIVDITAGLVAAFVQHNTISISEVPGLINSTFNALTSLGSADIIEVAPLCKEPAVSIKKSVTPDYIVCLEDGKKLKMLKRHLNTAYGLTPDEYRAKWGLPADYPMVAPNYAKSRSELAVKIGLGRSKAA
ncbi:MAG: MucR family transcriptional regulator [Rhodospirillaceae bacterium]